MLKFFRPTLQAKSLLLVLIHMVLLFPRESQADFVGTVSMSNSEIQARGVTYSFSLRFTRTITDTNGKLVIRFPDDFTTQFSVTGCTATSGFSTPAGSALTCTYLPSVRLLTIKNAFPTTFTEILFDVKGVTNPMFAKSTGYFSVDSYITSGGEFVSLESSSPTIVVTPTAGAISNVAMTLTNPTVGTYTDLLVAFKAAHTIPVTG